MNDQTPEARLAAALHESIRPVCVHNNGRSCQAAAAILAALPPDAHLFTVESLATAIFATDDPNFRFATRGNCERFAAAIIQAAKEASDANG